MIFIDIGVRDRLHQEDKKYNPDRHYLMKDSYSREEMLDKCHECDDFYKWNEHLIYDARTNRYYKKERVEYR